ncbi:hypothetical protein C8Q75DRAFT_497574 [Abortiporus biennis]|nr:hypothetical protein C8Q75DRAFT_497574 [Abortiporus biennis]
MHLSLFATFVFIHTVLAYVSVYFPLENQLPPIARIGEPFSWTFSYDTFISDSASAFDLTTSMLPAWLSFDPYSSTFHGTPRTSDEGTPEVTVTAHEPSSSGSVSSSFTLCITSYPPPILNHPLVEQFKLPNPSISSVFMVHPNSAFRVTRPALRVPPSWSFSIGFQYDTFIPSTPDSQVYYDALRADGSPLPDWISFNPRQITFDGFSPSQDQLINNSSTTVSLALHASDQKGYSAQYLPFDLIVSAHELSISAISLPTINITADTSFSISFTSPSDFMGVLLDGRQIQPSDISTLEIDTSYYGSWITYDTQSRTLSGTPPSELGHPGEETLLPVVLATDIPGQTIETNVSLAIVPSYFNESDLDPILVKPGANLKFDLHPYFSNATGLSGVGDVNLTASFSPDIDSVGEWDGILSFGVLPNATLVGMIPSNITSIPVTGAGRNVTHVDVTFTAYSRITHSTSHTTLPISFTPSDFEDSKRKHSSGSSSGNGSGASHKGGLSALTKSKLILGLKIGFSILGGMILLGGGLAWFRKFARVEDSAVSGEEGMRGWSEEDKKWYGIDQDGSPVRYGKTKGYLDPSSAAGVEEEEGGWSATADRDIMSPNPRSNATTTNIPLPYPNLGIGGVRHIQPGPLSPTSPHSMIGSPMMRKADFMERLRGATRKVSDTMRIVSDKYTLKPRFLQNQVSPTQPSSTTRRGQGPVIGKPILVMASLPPDHVQHNLTLQPTTTNLPPPPSSIDPYLDPDVDYSQYATTLDTRTSISGSPSSSSGDTGGRSRTSIPRRRADFRRPKSPLGPRSPYDIEGDDDADVDVEGELDMEVDGEEAVVHRAERAMSVKSLSIAGGRASTGTVVGVGVGIVQPTTTTTMTGQSPKARLVPFTHASKVPVPKIPTSVTSPSSPNLPPIPAQGQSTAPTTKKKRVVSQMAKVFRSASAADRYAKKEKERERREDGNEDELEEGIEYVKALGDESSDPSYSIETSPNPAAMGPLNPHPAKARTVPRMLARTTQQFKFRVPLLLSPTIPYSSIRFDTRLMNGKPLPKYIKVLFDTEVGRGTKASSSDGEDAKRIVELTGVPGVRDVGELNIGVFGKVGENGKEECVGRVIIEIVEKAKH